MTTLTLDDRHQMLAEMGEPDMGIPIAADAIEGELVDDDADLDDEEKYIAKRSRRGKAKSNEATESPVKMVRVKQLVMEVNGRPPGVMYEMPEDKARAAADRGEVEIASRRDGTVECVLLQAWRTDKIRTTTASSVSHGKPAMSVFHKGARVSVTVDMAADLIRKGVAAPCDMTALVEPHEFTVDTERGTWRAVVAYGGSLYRS